MEGESDTECLFPLVAHYANGKPGSRGNSFKDAFHSWKELLALLF